MFSTTQKYWLKERLRYLTYSICGLGLALIGLLGDVGYYYTFTGPGPVKFSGSEWVALILINGCLFAGGAVFFICLRRCLFAGDGRLMKSLLSQRTSESETAAMLLAQIDEDLAKGRVTFGKLRVGSEWILGDEAMRLSWLRGIFSVKERVRIPTNLPQWAYKLYLVDRNNTVQWTLMTRESELDSAVGYLSERLPDAFVGDDEDMIDFVIGNEENPPARQSVREMAPAQPFNFVAQDGVPTSRFAWQDVKKALLELRQEESVEFELLKPVEIPGGQASALTCEALEDEWMQVCLYYTDEEGRDCRFAQELEREEAIDIFEAYFYHRGLPDTAAWEFQVRTS